MLCLWEILYSEKKKKNTLRAFIKWLTNLELDSSVCLFVAEMLLELPDSSSGVENSCSCLGFALWPLRPGARAGVNLKHSLFVCARVGEEGERVDVFKSARLCVNGRVWVCAALCPCISSRGGGGGRGMVRGVSRSEAGKARAEDVLHMCEICMFMVEQVKTCNMRNYCSHTCPNIATGSYLKGCCFSFSLRAPNRG